VALSKAEICNFAWRAKDFALEGVDGKTYTLADVRGPKGTLVVFICNHCPYVKASIGRIGAYPDTHFLAANAVILSKESANAELAQRLGLRHDRHHAERH